MDNWNYDGLALHITLLDDLQDPTVPNALIARAITDAGFPVERKAVRRWREKRGVK